MTTDRNTNDPDDDSIDPKKYVFSRAEADENEISFFAASLKAGERRVCYYALSDYDVQPLHRLTHLCDTFVFVDSRSGAVSPAVVPDEWRTCLASLTDGTTRVGDQLKKFPNLVEVDGWEIFTKQLGVNIEMLDEPIAMLANGQRGNSWGAVLKLQRHVGGNSRDIWLLYVAGNPTRFYQSLMLNNKIVPEILLIGFHRHIQEAPREINRARYANWASCLSWDGGFGAQYRVSGLPLPKLICADTALGWPQNPAKYGFEDWPVILQTTGTYEVPATKPSAPPAKRHVTLTRKPVTPFSTEHIDAILLSENEFTACDRARWPQGLKVILTRVDFENVPQYEGQGIEFLVIGGKPLLKTLREIEEICAPHDVESLAISGLPAFEDEAADLLLWRQQEGPIKKLVLHLDCNGHMQDFACAADVID